MERISAASILPTSSERPLHSLPFARSPKPSSDAITICVWTSRLEPRAIPRKCLYSPSDYRPQPSAILLATETPARRS
jgi:hypothetical protein